MGFFDRFRKKKDNAPLSEAPSPAPTARAATNAAAAAVVVIREGMSPPSDEEMLRLLQEHAPEVAGLPRRGLAQPRWWRKEDWMQSGMRHIGAVLASEFATDPDETTFRVVRDERGARVGIVILHRLHRG